MYMYAQYALLVLLDLTDCHTSSSSPPDMLRVSYNDHSDSSALYDFHRAFLETLPQHSLNFNPPTCPNSIDFLPKPEGNLDMQVCGENGEQESESTLLPGLLLQHPFIPHGYPSTLAKLQTISTKASPPSELWPYLELLPIMLNKHPLFHEEVPHRPASPKNIRRRRCAFSSYPSISERSRFMKKMKCKSPRRLATPRHLRYKGLTRSSRRRNRRRDPTKARYGEQNGLFERRPKSCSDTEIGMSGIEEFKKTKVSFQNIGCWEASVWRREENNETAMSLSGSWVYGCEEARRVELGEC